MKEVPPEKLKAQFGEAVLEWARKMFAEELQSNFTRLDQFNTDRTKLYVRCLRAQPPKNLKILAKVLPLGVLWQTPDAIQRRNLLPQPEKMAVEKLRNDYDEEHRKNWDSLLEFERRKQDSKVKDDFKKAVKIGNKTHKEIALSCQAIPARAGSGEWGLIFPKNWGKLVVSLNLGRTMTTGYRLSLYAPLENNVRFRDHYLKELGIGAGSWLVENSSHYAETLLKVSKFALWHAQEYESIMNRILGI